MSAQRYLTCAVPAPSVADNELSSLLTAFDELPTHYNPPEVYGDSQSESDNSSDEEGSLVDNDDRKDSKEGEEESVVQGDYESTSSRSNNHLFYQIDDEDYDTVPSDHRNEDSLALSQEGISSDDFEDTFEEKEDGMEDDDFLLSALEQDGENENESPREQRDLEATLPSMVEINHNAPPSTVVEDQIRPPLPASDLLPKPKARKRPRKPKAKKEVETPKNWQNTAYILENIGRVRNPSSSRQKRTRVLSETQPADQAMVRTSKRARLDQDGKASSSAGAALTTIAPKPSRRAGGTALTKSSFNKLWDEVARLSDYKPAEVPSVGKTDYHAKLLVKHPHLKGDGQRAFFAKEYRLGNDKAIACPVEGCGAPSTVGEFHKHVGCQEL
ncbi:hypothetical protein CPB85DRAFT_1253226 [Mucidula mucida]|nr:hypothetical protein CPB85DRAFT_1253226 [Mucidula mucida]